MKDRFESTKDLQGKVIVYSCYHEPMIKLIKNAQFDRFNMKIISHLFTLFILILWGGTVLWLHSLGILGIGWLYLMWFLIQLLILGTALNYIKTKNNFLKSNTTVLILNDGLLFVYADIITLFGKFMNPLYVPFEHIKDIKMDRIMRGPNHVIKILKIEIKDEYKTEYPELMVNHLSVFEEEVSDIDKFKKILEEQMKSYLRSGA